MESTCRGKINNNKSKAYLILFANLSPVANFKANIIFTRGSLNNFVPQKLLKNVFNKNY